MDVSGQFQAPSPLLLENPLNEKDFAVSICLSSHFSISSRPALESTQLPIKWIPGVKRQGREADHSPPTSAEAKKMWIYTSTLPYVFMA
jgi:hypothetical protein